jgi:hypothetical protein
VDLVVRWTLPEGLPEDALIAAQVRVFPADLPPGALRRLVEEEADLSHPVDASGETSTTFRVQPGPALIIVRSELGRVERAVEVGEDGKTVVEVPLAP